VWEDKIQQLMDKAAYLADIASESRQPMNLQRVSHTEEFCTETSMIEKNFKNFDRVLDFIDGLADVEKAEYVTAGELGDIVSHYL